MFNGKKTFAIIFETLDCNFDALLEFTFPLLMLLLELFLILFIKALKEKCFITKFSTFSRLGNLSREFCVRNNKNLVTCFAKRFYNHPH